LTSRICIFEDNAVNNFYPLTYTRPVFELLCGMTSLREKIERLFPKAEVHLLCREELAPLLRRQVSAPVNEPQRLEGKTCLFINGRLLAPKTAEALMVDMGWALTVGDDVVAAHLTAEGVRDLFADGVPAGAHVVRVAHDRCASVPTPLTLLNYPWNIVSRNGEVIASDFEATKRGGQRLGKVFDGVYVIGGSSDMVYVGEGAIVMPGCVLDLSEGPIYVDNDATLRPPSYVQGPCYIGEDSLIDGAKVREACSFGRICKIGGEVEATVFQALSNKHHEGFIGHAYVGEWVNLGALATNSDLKNNYKPVSVQLSADGAAIDTGDRFVGCTIGDHTKVGIGGLLNTGTILGVGCNIFGGGMPPKYVASFCWGGADGFVEHRLDKMLETAGIVMKRRKVDLDATYRGLMERLFEMTAADREVFLK
jgi:UDP-N-acetylglucosamine diphosphorylase/glucosamine-1-phosphate N-acetyltransferase